MRSPILEGCARDVFYNSLDDQGQYHEIELVKLEFDHSSYDRKEGVSSNIHFKIQIQQNDDHPFPTYFKSGRSPKTIAMCEKICRNIESQIRETCSFNTNVYFNGWEIGSIIITGTVWNEDIPRRDISIHTGLILTSTQRETQKLFTHNNVIVMEEQKNISIRDEIHASIQL